MLLGLIDNSKRSKPLFSGQKAICPLCETELIGKCGDIYIWHWQHVSLTYCDSWKENEGEWHKEWKSHFPEENQEIIISKDGEKHIADVKTSTGTVIEFQNSSISAGTIYIREQFYDNMIWIINAQFFVKNLRIRSLVTQRLRENENHYLEECSNSDAFYDDTIKEYEIRKQEWKRKKSLLEYKLGDFTSDISICLNASEDFNAFLKTIMPKLYSSTLFEPHITKEVIFAINEELKTTYKKCSERIEQLNFQKNNCKEWLNTFKRYDDFHDESNHFKIIPPEISINSESFANVFAILLNEIRSIFPNVITFNNKIEFERIKGNSNYCLLVKRDDFESKSSQKVLDLDILVTKELLSKKNLFEKIKQQVTVQLALTLSSLEGDKLKLEQEIEECDLVVSNITESITEAKKSKQVDHDEIVELGESKQKTLNTKIMSECKGLYTFEWKNERKSWQNSTKSIYLDIGETYLFEIIKNDLLKKTDKNSFIEFHSKR